jgi:high-affinity Fe2+/Pb2+ permease
LGAAVAAFFAGKFANKLVRIGGMILGGVAGFFLGFTLYNLVFA